MHLKHHKNNVRFRFSLLAACAGWEHRDAGADVTFSGGAAPLKRGRTCGRRAVEGRLRRSKEVEFTGMSTVPSGDAEEEDEGDS